MYSILYYSCTYFPTNCSFFSFDKRPCVYMKHWKRVNELDKIFQNKHRPPTKHWHTNLLHVYTRGATLVSVPAILLKA